MRAQAQLQAYEERLNRIAETIPNGLLMLDTDGRITFANRAAVHIIGVDDESLIGERSSTLLSHLLDLEDASDQDFFSPFGKVLQTGMPLNGPELSLTRQDGSRAIISANAAPFNDPASTISRSANG